MLRHTGEQPFACIVCGNTFARKDLRNRHMKATHYKNERPPQRVLGTVFKVLVLLLSGNDSKTKIRLVGRRELGRYSDLE